MVSGTGGRKKIREIGAKPIVTFYMDYISGVEFLEKKGCANPATIVSFYNLNGGRRIRVPG